jgi:hypothetical protein
MEERVEAGCKIGNGHRSYTSPRVSEAQTQIATAKATRDPADEAMCARARERYAADRKSRFRRRRKRHAAMPSLIIIGGLKCGTTSIHHYLGLHPEIQMSKPKELNFFCEELNWDLGLDWYASRFDSRFKVRGESSPHYTNLPCFTGVPARIREHCPDARLLYMVRDPIKRILSHWVHATGAGYETGDLVEVLSNPDTSYTNRSKYWMQLQPYLEHFDGVDETFTSEQFDREWEKSGAKEGDKYQLMEKLIKLPGFRSFDRNFDRLPEPLRWRVEKLVHDPEKPPAPKPKLPDDLFETVRARFTTDVAALQKFAGREFAGWHDYS